MRAAKVVLALAIALPFAGCTASEADADKVIQEMITDLRAFTDIMKGIGDADSSKAANARLQAAFTKFKESKARADKTKVSKSTGDTVVKKHQEELLKTMLELGVQMTRVKSIPGTSGESAIADSLLVELQKKS